MKNGVPFAASTPSPVGIRAHLHQASESTLQQLCDGASDAVLIEN